MCSINIDKKYSQPSNEFSLFQNETPKRDIRKEMILYFYSSMLQSIIKEKEITLDESVESIPSTERILYAKPRVQESPRRTNNPHELIVESEELEMETNSLRFSLRSPKKRRTSLKRRQGRQSKQSITRESLLNDFTPSKKKFRSTTKINRRSSDNKCPIASNLSLDCHRPTNWMLDHTEEYVKIEFNNGNKYEGTVTCNMLHGQGKFTWSNGTVYEGEFKNNEISGIGRFEYPDKSVYSGEVYKHYCHGSGLLFPSISPCIYKGTFRLNLKHGHGWQLFDNNNTYEGEWTDGQLSGQGFRIYPSGAKYYGKFFMGKRHGYGVAVLKNHDVYAGEWVQGKRDGFGDYIWNVQNENYFAVQVQSCYYGSWVDNKRDGIGLINFGMEGGARYAGYFANNEKHGSGVLICENGNVIESNPLFINDKPVHVADCGNIESLQPINSVIELPITEEEASIYNEIYTDDISDFRQESLLKRFPLNEKLPYATPSSDRSTKSIRKTFKQNKYNAKIFKELFPKFMDQYSSLNIPIGVSCELIDLNTHIYKIIEYKSRIQQEQNSNKMKDNHESQIFLSRSSSAETYSDYELHNFEEKLIRKSITKYLRQLKKIYKLYAIVGCLEKDITFKPWLMRVCFWQLYRDCKIPEKGISLIDIDLMFSEKSTFDSYVVHNPFEVIYFCQYLENLLHVAFALYGEVFINSDDGILKQSFDYFMDNDILPNAGHFKGSALFEYRDLIPMQAAYAWYKSFGEPHSVRDFFRNIKKIEKVKKQIQCKEIFDKPYIQIGRNVINCGNKIFYFEDDENLIPNKPIREKVQSIQHEDLNKLNFLSGLTSKHISKIIYSICPTIRDKKDIINFEYKLSFLEFYEIILHCTQEKIKIQMSLSLIKEIEVLHFTKKKKVSLPRKSKKAQG